MRRIKNLLMKLATTAVFAVAITTVASTSRDFIYQPQSDETVMKNYRKKYLEK